MLTIEYPPDGLRAISPHGAIWSAARVPAATVLLHEVRGASLKKSVEQSPRSKRWTGSWAPLGHRVPNADLRPIKIESDLPIMVLRTRSLTGVASHLVLRVMGRSSRGRATTARLRWGGEVRRVAIAHGLRSRNCEQAKMHGGRPRRRARRPAGGTHESARKFAWRRRCRERWHDACSLCRHK